MGKGVHDKESQLRYVTNRVKMLGDVVDAIDPHSADIQDIDQIINMLDDLSFKCRQFRRDWEDDSD